MAWLADLAGKAENLLNNIDEQTGAALRNHNGNRKKNDKPDYALTPENQSTASQKKRPIRTLKKVPHLTETKPINTSAPRKLSPPPKQPKTVMKESNVTVARLSSPLRFNANRSPDKMIAGDIKNNETDRFGLKHRRYSLPSDLELVQHENFVYKMQNLEVENAMLKNELNVMNREVAELLDRLRKTEDGNDVVSEKELKDTMTKLERTDAINCRMESDQETWCSQIDMLKTKINNLMNEEVLMNTERNKDLELEVTLLQGRNKELEELIRQLNENCSQHESNRVKLENELRHAQNTIQELEANGERVLGECRRLEKDWDAYKLRVKNMLSIKDTEIKSLQEGLNLTEDSKILIDQIETLKEEREELSEEVSRVRSECSEMRRQTEQADERHRAADRVIKALREALRDERTAKTVAENHSAALAKDLKTLQTETNHTISVLRATIRDKESEIKRLGEDTVRTPDTSSLNVADYGDQDTIDTEKIHYLTETLVHRQEKIEALLADNNVLRIQMDKMESKYKAELSSLRATQKHVVNLQDECRTRRGRITGSISAGFGRVVGFNLKRYPLFRIFVLLYMLALHFWVLTVLLTSTPDTYNFLKGKNIPIQV